jgi:Pyruvate/2-oxoacid:ferredoxin oxidoreductase gamma subunit
MGYNHNDEDFARRPISRGIHPVVEHAVLLTGIGGQGVQLAARTLAVAAVKCDLEVMVFGDYGGLMRGGNTDATIVIGDDPLRSPPTVAWASMALVMHHEYWPGVRDRLVPGSVVIIDRSVFKGEIGLSDVIEVEATAVASEMGNSRGGSMVALGALAAATGLVDLAHLSEAAFEVLPPYRAEHAQANADALAAGFGLIEQPAASLWPTTALAR